MSYKVKHSLHLHVFHWSKKEYKLDFFSFLLNKKKARENKMHNDGNRCLFKKTPYGFKLCKSYWVHIFKYTLPWSILTERFSRVRVIYIRAWRRKSIFIFFYRIKCWQTAGEQQKTSLWKSYLVKSLIWCPRRP